jgi:hypothetical protein
MSDPSFALAAISCGFRMTGQSLTLRCFKEHQRGKYEVVLWKTEIRIKEAAGFLSAVLHVCVNLFLCSAVISPVYI